MRFEVAHAMAVHALDGQLGLLLALHRLNTASRAAVDAVLDDVERNEHVARALSSARIADSRVYLLKREKERRLLFRSMLRFRLPGDKAVLHRFYLDQRQQRLLFVPGLELDLFRLFAESRYAHRRPELLYRLYNRLRNPGSSVRVPPLSAPPLGDGWEVWKKARCVRRKTPFRR